MLLKISLLFGISGPLLLRVLISTAQYHVAQMTWISCILSYVIFFGGGFIIFSIGLWMFSMTVVQRRWKKLILHCCILLLLIMMILLVIYTGGLIGLHYEIRQLRNHLRPVTWSQFYNKYPVTPEDAPEYQLMRKALIIMESMPQPIDSKLTVPDGKQLSPEEVSAAAKSVNFQKYMHQLLNLKPLVWTIHSFFDTEPLALHKIKCIDRKYLDYYLNRKDYVHAVATMDFLQKARIIELNNVDYGISSEINIDEYSVLLNSHEVPIEVLHRWLRELEAEETELNNARTRMIDINNIRTIVDPITFLDRCCLHAQAKPLPLCLQFINPYLRWRNLQINRQNENITYAENQARSRKRNNSSIFQVTLVCAEVCGIIFNERDFWHNFIFSCWVNLWTDPNEGYFFYLTELRIIKGGIASELYFRKYGNIPEKPEQLCPEFIMAVPLDACTQKPLQYTPLSHDSVKVHSPEFRRELILSKKKGSFHLQPDQFLQIRTPSPKR